MLRTQRALGESRRSMLDPCRIIMTELYSTLKKILKRLQLLSSEASVNEEHKSEVKKEVDQLHNDLDQIIKRIREIRMKSVVPAPLLVACSHTQQWQFIGRE